MINTKRVGGNLLLELLEHPAGSFVKEDGEVVTHGKP